MSDVALIVDDSAVNRQLLARHLASIGIDVARGDRRPQRRSRRCATELGGQVGVVLLDVVMPEMDGYETLAAIKADEALRHVPVIMISGVDELDSVVRCIELGATDYLPKPFNPTILAARVRASLADKRLRDLEVEHAARQAELLETIERQKEELSRFLSPQVAALVSSRGRPGSCSPAIGARQRRCSATCAASPRSAIRPSRRRCWACCASTTRRWAR